MDPAHKNIIRRNYLQLADDLQTAIDYVCNHIWSANIISDAMKANILENLTPRKKTEALLDLIPSRGPTAFNALYKAFLGAELYGAADILRPDRKPHNSTTVTEEEEI